MNVDAEVVQQDLLQQSLVAASIKARQVAQANRKKIGSVISVNEMTTGNTPSSTLVSNRVVTNTDGSDNIMMIELTQSLSVTYYLHPWWRFW